MCAHHLALFFWMNEWMLYFMSCRSRECFGKCSRSYPYLRATVLAVEILTCVVAWWLGLCAWWVLGVWVGWWASSRLGRPWCQCEDRCWLYRLRCCWWWPLWSGTSLPDRRPDWVSGAVRPCRTWFRWMCASANELRYGRRPAAASRALVGVVCSWW